MIAIERKLDLFGVVFLGAITAIGGGIVRDVLLGQTPPKSFSNYIYLLVAVITALIVFCVAYIWLFSYASWQVTTVGRYRVFVSNQANNLNSLS